VLLRVIGAFQAGGMRWRTSGFGLGCNWPTWGRSKSGWSARKGCGSAARAAAERGEERDRGARAARASAVGRSRPSGGLDPDEEKAISSFGFLTLKPTLVVISLGDEQDGAALGSLRSEAVAPRTACWRFPGRLEMERRLSPDDALNHAGDGRFGLAVGRRDLRPTRWPSSSRFYGW
jgi:hypothetical protein